MVWATEIHARNTRAGLIRSSLWRRRRQPAHGNRLRCRRHAAPAKLYKRMLKKEPEMNIPFFKEMKIGAYLLKQKLLGRKRYPLVLMLEPLFRCNLACVGCGKIDYPDAILNRRLSVDECLAAVDECGAPMVAIPGGEPLIHKDIGEIVKGIVARKQVRLPLHQCAAAGEEAPPVRAVALSVLFGPPRRPQGAPRQIRLPRRRVRAGGVGDPGRQGKGFAVNVNATVFDGHPAEDIAAFLDFTTRSASAFRSRPAMPMSARPTRSTSSTAGRPRNCSARSSRWAKARTGT